MQISHSGNLKMTEHVFGPQSLAALVVFLTASHPDTVAPSSYNDSHRPPSRTIDDM